MKNKDSLKKDEDNVLFLCLSYVIDWINIKQLSTSITEYIHLATRISTSVKHLCPTCFFNLPFRAIQSTQLSSNIGFIHLTTGILQSTKHSFHTITEVIQSTNDIKWVSTKCTS